MGFPLPRPARWPRPLRLGAQALGGLLCAYLAAQGVARLPAVRAALRGRIAAAIQARLGPVEMAPEVEVDPLFRVRFGPLAVAGVRASDPPLLRVESIRVRPDLLALARTRRVAAASIRLAGVRVEIPERRGALRELVERLGATGGGRDGGDAREPGDAPIVRVRDLTVGFSLGGQRLTAGPIQASVFRRRDAEGSTTASADLRFAGAGQGTVVLRSDRQGWHLLSRFDGMDRRAVPPELASVLAAWSGGTLSASLSGDAAAGLEDARCHVQVRAAGLRVGGAGAGPEPIGPLDVSFGGELSWSGEARRARLSAGRLVLPGDAAVAVEAALEVKKGLPFSLDLRADAVDYLRAVSALPPQLALPAGAPRPTGTLDAHAALSGSLVDPAGWRVDASLELSRMREAARRAPPVALRSSFLHRVRPDDGPERSFVVGPDNPAFVPIGALPRHVVGAVTASEDGGFFAHSGFDFAELRNAAVEGAQAGHVVRGGSTITQQVAKNLYLSREKTLARKLREALVTIALEATLPKQRVLELYLNIAEWGPGVWGIGPAARHWFGKDARDLTPREAAFLATVIPNPVRYHYMWTRGSLSEAWTRRVDDLLRRMSSQGLLGDDELAQALEEPLVFASPAATSPASDGAEEPPPPGDDSTSTGDEDAGAGPL